MANKVTYAATNQNGETTTYDSLDDFYNYIHLDDPTLGLVIKPTPDRRNEWQVLNFQEQDIVLWTLKTLVVTVPDSPQQIAELEE
jgi:hypothetical protein